MMRALDTTLCISCLPDLDRTVGLTPPLKTCFIPLMLVFIYYRTQVLFQSREILNYFLFEDGLSIRIVKNGSIQYARPKSFSFIGTLTGH